MLFYFPNRPTLIPPDPENPINPEPDYINSLEASGQYVAEQKWNGDNTLIHIENEGQSIKLWNRKHEPLKYSPIPSVVEELRMWGQVGGNCIINCETVNSKTVAVKNKLIVHCVMAWQGQYLIGKNWGDSRDILDTCVEQGLSGTHVQISKVWRAGFWKLFQDADGKIIEGIILKNPAGKLVFSTTMPKDVSWMLKIRKPCAKYKF